MLNPHEEQQSLFVPRKPSIHTNYTFLGLREYLESRNKPQKPWATVEELARVFDGRADRKNCVAMRRRLTQSRLRFIDESMFLVMQYDGDKGRGRILAVKIFNRDREEDVQYAQSQLNKMEERREVKGKQLEKAKQLVFGFLTGENSQPS